MASIDEKLDRLLEDMSTMKTVSSFHTAELIELKSKLDPVFAHVVAVKMIAKLVGGVIGGVAGVGALILGVIQILK